MSSPAKQVDPRDLFITRNPTGLTSDELEKGRSGFVDHRTHGDYLVFLSGYEAAACLDPSDEAQGQNALIEAEGCKPEISIRPVTSAAAGTGAHDLNQAEGEQPDFNSPIHPDDMPAIVEQHRDFMKLTDLNWMDEASSLQDHAYALGQHRGRTAVIPTASSAGLPDVLPAVAVEGDQLVIRITTECLLHAVTCSPEWPINGDGSPIQVNDGALLVKEIIHELQRENEHGTNQMHRMFDEAAVSALDNGSQAVSYDGEDEE